MRVDFSPPDIREEDINEVVRVLSSGWITTGPETKAFENYMAEHIGTNRVLCLNSATAALFLSLKILGVGPGDEVITSAYTYTASASVITHVGATPVFLDVKENSFEMDYSKLDTVITSKTKAIIAVDFAGSMCDYDAIYEKVEDCKDKFVPGSSLQEKLGRVAVIADAAHSIGAVRNGKNSGQAADFTCFSFHAVKNITTAEGGAVTWRSIPDVDDNELYNLFRTYSLHGQTKDALEKNQLSSWEYDIIYPAYKYNMTDVAAALGFSQYKRYDQLLARRYALAEQYKRELEGTPLWIYPHKGENFTSSHHLLITRVEDFSCQDRNQLIKALAERDICTNVHYKPLPMFKGYKDRGYDIKNYPNAVKMYENEITLPLHTKLTDDQVTYVTDSIKDILRKG